MAGAATIQINITGTQDVIDKLNGAKDIFTDFKDALTEVGKELTAYYSEEPLESRGGVFGTPWAQLAKSTQAYKKKHYRQYTTVPLMRTGTMMRSFKFAAGPRALIVSNPTPYFAYHQSTETRHKIPWRPMMWINQPVKDIIETTIKADIDERINAL